MDNNMANEPKVLIISISDSFLAKSLKTKLSNVSISAECVRADIKEIDKFADKMDLTILFMSEDLEGMPEIMVYLKDMIHEKQKGLILIGDEPQYLFVKKQIPPTYITDWYKRPLDIESLIKGVETYLNENTGEKRKKTVLIVDDDITYMRTVYEWLRGTYHVGMASNGVQAITYLAKNKADLILLDYEMPIANGPQVLSMLKNDSETGQIPVMFLTGHGDKDRVLSVIGLSPVDYLLKTISRNELLNKIGTFFATR